MGLFAKIGAALLKIKGAVMATTATKVATVAIAAVAVVGGTVVVTQADVFASPESKVENALQSLSEKETGAFEELFGWEAFFEDISEKGLDAEFNITFEDIPVDELGISIPNIGVGLNCRFDAKASRTEVVAGAKVADTTLLSANIYVDEDKAVASVPELFSGAIGANYADSDFVEQLKNSELVAMLGEEFAAVLEAVPDTFGEVKDSAETAALVKDYLDALDESKDELLSKMEAEKTGEATVLVNGEEVKCKEYKATFGPEDVEAFLTVLIDETVAFYDAYMEENAENMDPALLEELEARKSSEEMLAELEALKEELKGKIGETVLLVYLNGKRLVMADLTFVLDGAKVNLNVLFGMEGNRYDNMHLTLDMTKYEETMQLFALTHSTENTDDAFSSEWLVSVEGEETVKLVFNYEKLAGDFLFAVILPDEEVEAAVEGVLTIPKKGKEFVFELDDISITQYGEKVSLGFKTEVSLKVFEGEIAAPEEIRWDVVSMSALEWERLVTEITGNIYSMVMKLMFSN